MRRILVAGLFVVAVALAVPAGASAWTPEDCAAWYQEHGSNHPDCQDYVPPPVNVTVCVNGQTVTVPENQVPEGSTPGECVVAPPPPVDTTPPVVTVPPPVVDVPPVPPVDTPNLVPTPVAHAHPHPNQVEGKEQQKGGGGGHIGTPVSVAGTETSGPTLPFTGLGLLPLVLMGAALSLAGFAGYRALRT